MKQTLKDVGMILIVVILSIIAALAIGWLISGCDPFDGPGPDDTDTETETESETESSTEVECLPILDQWCITTDDVRGDYAAAANRCADLGSEWMLPGAAVFVELCKGGCDGWTAESAAGSYYCHGCPGWMHNAYWTADAVIDKEDMAWAVCGNIEHGWKIYAENDYTSQITIACMRPL